MNNDPGRSLVIYKIGLRVWSYSLDGKPAGRSFPSRAEAVREATKALEKKVLKL
jgi:hypothetical protein